MARNRIEELLVELKFKGGEELKKISGGFRELGKAVNLADADIEDARTKIIDYGKTLGNTNQAVKGTIQALKALQDSTQRGGEAWTQLSRDVLQFEQAARLTDREIESLRRGIVAEANAHSQSETSIRAHVRALQELRAQSVLGGQVNRQLSQTIGQLTQQLDQAEQASRAHFSALNQALAVRPDAVLRQWQAYTQILRDVRATAEQAAEAQQRLNQLAGAPRISARRELVARAGIQADPAYQERFGLGGRSLEALPDVPAALSLRLRELQEDLNFTTRNTGLYIRTLVEMAAVQRQASATTQGFAAALREQLASGELPRTQKNLQEVIGALRREMVELDTSTATGSRAYAENAAQVRVLERELNQLANSYRNVADMAVQAATAERSAATARVTALYMNNRAVRDQAQAMSELGNAVRSGIAGTPLMLPAAGQTSAPGTGLQVSGGARIGGPSGNIQRVLTPGTFPGERQQGPEISPEQADRNRRAYISQIDAERQLREAREASEAQLQGYRAEISKAAQANDGSINSIQRYRDSLVTLRNTLPATGNEFRKLSSQVERLDAQLERAQRRRRRMSAMEATQAAGAVISGGIFGGPEGAIGGAIGTAVGGVPGAFAGAAIGAQVGMVRQQIGMMADYAASIQKLQIALRGIVGTQSDYNFALSAASTATRELNVPQETAISGMTRLSAAVLGAGGNVQDSAFAFRSITEAIKATGGTAAQVDGAILALTQVFSKGKVSAEELNQIAERLPGTFTLFAKAAGKSGPELQKALQQGQVGLADLFKFLVLLRGEFSDTAGEIAKSSQDAGARLSIAFNEARLQIGAALQPVGAAFQEAFTGFIVGITPAVVGAARGIAAAIKAIANNEALGAIAAFALQMGATALAVKALQAAFTALAATKIATFFSGASASAKITGDVLATTTAQTAGLRAAMIGLLGALKGIATIGAITVAVNILVNNFARLMAAREALRELQKQRDPVGEYGPEMIMTAERRYTGASQEKIVQDQEKQRKYASRLRREIAVLGKELKGRKVLENTALGFFGTTAIPGLEEEIKLKREQLRNAEEVLNLDIKGYKTKAQFEQEYLQSIEKRFKVEQKDAASKEKKKKEERVELSQVPRLLLEQQLQADSAEIQDKIRDAQQSGNNLLEIRLQGEQKLLQLRNQAQLVQFEDLALQEKALKLTTLYGERDQAIRQIQFDMQKAFDENLKKAAAGLDELLIGYANQIVKQERINELLATGMTPGLAEQVFLIEQAADKETELLTIELGKLEALKAQNSKLVDMLKLEEDIARVRGLLTGVGARKATAVEGATRVTQGPTDIEKLRETIKAVKGELAKLTDPVGQIIGAATAIGDAFGNAFKGVITGSVSAKEALAGFFSSVAEYFADMAAKMIAEWIKLAILNTIVRIFNPAAGAAAGGAGLSDLSAPASINNPLGVLNANGNAFAQNGIVPYAKGGIVNSPTLFKFARGSAMATGVMGEAGPEAIMPLKRGPDGKLGVAGGGSGATTVNVSVDAKGTQVQGDSAQGAALGRVIAGAVQAELIKQQRPGGLLSGGR